MIGLRVYHLWFPKSPENDRDTKARETAVRESSQAVWKAWSQGDWFGSTDGTPMGQQSRTATTRVKVAVQNC